MRPARAAPVRARSIRRACMRLPQSTLAQNFDEYRRACSHFCLWRINSPCAPTSTRFSPTSSPLMVRRLGGHVASSAFLPGKRRLHCFRNAEAERFTRRFYPPPVWKVNAAVMFRKAAKRERCESGATCILGWAYRGAWGSACRLAKLSRNREHGGQRGLRRVARRHAASPRPVADDSPYLPEAEASMASLRRCRKGERNRCSANGRPRSHGRADDENRGGPLHVALARGGKGCAAQRHCFGTACRRAAVCACLLVGRGPSSGGWKRIVGAMGGTRGPPAKVGRRVAAPRRTATCTCQLFAPAGSISGSPDGSRHGQRSSAPSKGRKSAARGSRGRTASPRSQARGC